MKTLKKIIIALVVLIAIALIAALFVPKDYTVTREVTINKPKGKVFNYIKYLKNQHNYSKWSQMDPNMETSYTGTDGEVGFVSAWKGNKDVGSGEQEIIGITEGERIDTELRFFEPMEGISPAYMTTEATSDNETKVTWGFKGHIAYPMNLMCLVMDKQIGPDLQEGLDSLKVVLEAQPVVEAGSKDFLLNYFNQTKENLKKSVTGLSEAQLKFKPADSVWSVAQVLEHIVGAEPMIFGMTTQSMKAPENPEMRDSIALGDEEIIGAITDRSQKAKAPDALQPKEKYTDAKAALADLNEGRKPILKYIDSVPLKSLRNHVIDFPTGKADGYQSLLFNAAHTARHTLQIEEVKAHSDFPEN
ncbi:DinB family protein [Galbibacter sp. EGI 63066]|uniref:DinB family protein n=1 Tax=Galbibacter sp. EGI 63066 TaxID=2993559 RepID=UPI0022490AE2|nr:DinB family protein [Galbibacter sp. EGI 63066]MCX2679143.1 DinB family protein [Galbibacter sp. EGI 63066]